MMNSTCSRDSPAVSNKSCFDALIDAQLATGRHDVLLKLDRVMQFFV